MDKALLDTDIFSHVLKAKDPALVRHAAAYQEEFGAFTVSAVTVMEIVKGFQRVQRDDALERFLRGVAGIQVIPFDTDTATFAGRIYGDLERTGQPIGRADPMIAATAIRHDLTLATRNTTHFRRIQTLGYPLALVVWCD